MGTAWASDFIPTQWCSNRSGNACVRQIPDIDQLLNKSQPEPPIDLRVPVRGNETSNQFHMLASKQQCSMNMKISALLKWLDENVFNSPMEMKMSIRMSLNPCIKRTVDHISSFSLVFGGHSSAWQYESFENRS